MASYALSIKPYAIRPRSASARTRAWIGRLRRTSIRAGAQIQQWGRKLSPWYDESEHGNTLVMWS
jgi:hypothetical protein